MKKMLLLLCLACALPLSATSFTMVVDAGSTGSRFWIFEMSAEGTLQRHWVKKFEGGGIHSAQDEASLTALLQPLYVFAKTTLEGEGIDVNTVPLWFRSSGGMRSLPETSQVYLLGAIEDYFRRKGLKNVSAEIISGRDEAVYAWIAANFLHGQLGGSDTKKTSGILDMGGASTQIAFLPKATPHKHGLRLYLGEHSYDLYAHSYEGIGKENTVATIAGASCFQSGLETDEELESAPLFRALVDSDFNASGKKAKGDFASCKSDLEERLLERLQHAVEMEGHFIAIGAFASFASAFNLSRLSEEKMEALGQKLCAQSWQAFRGGYQKRPLRYLAANCFETAYYALLFSKAREAEIATQKGRKGPEISWALGIVVFHHLGGLMTEIPKLPEHHDEL